ncbi:BTAD domain-containing putative transcriptional regulator [Streptomyces sp. NPDC032472]|uniref:BTAD domain-containing putative transcriptional regulator n=1 Tax=Streptomyces sp. NPDC032472 TaxID=3155018 RepID=UPI0033D5F5C5
MVSLRVLGSFTAERDGERIPLGGHRQRSVLALLVAARGRTVSAERMIEDLWQGAAPARAMASLQAYVSNLRRLLEPGRAPRTAARLLVTSPPGYAVRLPEDAVDAWRFERLVGEARKRYADEPGAAGELLREALALWQGAAYAEVADEPWSHGEVLRLNELRASAREWELSAGLRGGDRARVVAQAALLTREEPLREEGWRLHALALWAEGRQADALAALRRAREVLAQETGLDPGTPLVTLERAVLTQDLQFLERATDPAPALAAGRPGAGAGMVGDAGAGTTTGTATGAITPAGSGVFVGRDAELAALEAAARRVGGGGPGVVLVTGEAGVGKTALLGRFRERLQDEGWLVAVGRNTDTEGAPPAWAWAEALREVAAVTPPGPGAAAVLAPLLYDGLPEQDAAAVPGPHRDGVPAAPGRSGHGAAGAVGGGGTAVAECGDAGMARDAGAARDVAAGRFLLRRTVWGWVGTVGVSRPLCIVLDDLHWADAESLALLAGAAELPADSRVLVVCAHRSDEVSGALADTLAVLARRSPLRLPLPGLAAPAVAEVVRSLGVPEADPETVAALTERTGGNPFYVRESARLLAGEGALVALSEVPEGVRDVLRRRLRRLPEEAVAVLRLAAVAGREAEVEVLVGAADAGEDAVLGALEAGLVAGLLLEPAPGRVRFAHALVRDTLLADLSALRAARMHGRIAAALEGAGSRDVSGLAHHFVRAASSATAAKAVEYCVRAAGLAEARHAHEAAAALLADAVDAFGRVPAGAGGDRDGECSILLGRLTRAQVRAGAVMAARATRRTAIDRAVAASRDDLLVRAFTSWPEPVPWQSRPYGMVDRPVVELLERLLQRPGLAPDLRCRLLVAYTVELSDERLPAVLAAAREAVALADGQADPVLRASTLAALARELDADLQWREREELGRELEELAAAHDLPVHRWYGLFVRSTAAAARGDVRGVRRLVDAYAELARTYALPGPAAVCACVEATLAHVAGRTAEAEQGYRRATALMARQGSPHAEGYLAIALTTLRAGEGRLAECVPAAREAFTRYGPSAADLLAAALAAAGEREEARAVLDGAGPLPANYFFKVFGSLRATTLVALGEREGAAELYAQLLPYRDAPPPSSGFTVATRPVAYALGELALLLGRPAEAAAHAERAAAITRQWKDVAPPTARR